jgi:GDP-4-dehydro-6-deoxy-D-mannose reductase
MSGRRVFITGRNGFVGKHLEEAIASAGRTEATTSFVCGPSERLDVRDRASLRRELESAQPDLVVHLAAQSFVPESFRDPQATYETNFFGTLHLLQALEALSFTGRMLYIGSGDEYGRVAEAQLPVNERHPLRPRNPYAVSKVAGEALCFQWSQSGRFEVVMARPFNHIGPGQGERFVVSDFARQIATIRRGGRAATLEAGDVDVTRDFTDVRDVARAYMLLLDAAGANGEVFNVCSGAERSPREIIERLAHAAGVSVTIKQDAARLRPSEQRRMCGSFEKLRAATGWTPEIGIDQSLRDILDDWTRKEPA